MSRQYGFSLMELMVAIVISMVVAAAMTELMANTLGNSTDTTAMVRLTQESRTALQLMSRDVRRSGYTSDAVQCYANYDCASDGSVSLPGDISYSATKDCFTFQHDRNHDGDATNDGAGAFRRKVMDGVGVMEMWIGGTAPSCSTDGGDWIVITNPEILDVFRFIVDDSPSYTEVIDIEPDGTVIQQKVRKVRMRISARLTGNPTISRTMENVIKVRNDVVVL